MAYEPPQNLVLVGDHHIVRGDVFVIAGPPGVGKSRATLAFAQAGAIKAAWFGLATHCLYKTLIIQNENGRYRLKRELGEINESKLDSICASVLLRRLACVFGKTSFVIR